MSRRRTGAPLDQITSTVRASAFAVCGESAARRTRRSGISALQCGLIGWHGAVKGEAKMRLACAVGGNGGVHFLDVVATLGNRLAAALEAGSDLLDLGARVLQGIDPIPFGREPIAREV